ncbi:MAG: gliding motility-associated C-terminal domain-containing protein [Flavobacteriales bacterium]|nr:gliding motility-associated C-terminal domain-containing protein [Flavobacteriales bacterium]
MLLQTVKRSYVRFFFALIASVVCAQLQESHWLFGFNGEVVFNDNIPQDVGTGPLYVTEGSASISTADGVLQFYTDGSNIYDNTGTPMPNGNVVQGDDSSTQNVLIVPQPGDDDERFYYVFGVPSQIDNNGGTVDSGLEVVLVDMQSNNGLGDVVEGPTILTESAAEMLHATYHANGRDVWVVMHEMDSSNWHAFLVSCDGIVQHQISESGRYFESADFGITAIGSLKVSPDGNRIAATYSDFNEIDLQDSTYLMYGSFNNTSGLVDIQGEVIKYTDFSHQGYGVCFSPNSELLYWSILSNPPGLYQYQLDVPDVAASEYLVSADLGGFGSMGIGPDAKIYIARGGGSQFLSVLNNPDLPGAQVNYEAEALPITGFSSLGLPNLWMYPYPDQSVLEEQEDIDICNGDEVELIPEATIGDYLWSTGETTESIVVNETGEYWVEISNGCHLLSRWVYNVTETPKPEIEFEILPNVICEGDEFSVEVILPIESWMWSDGSLDNPRLFTDEVKPIVLSEGNCTWEELPELTIETKPTLDFPEFFEFCDDEELRITANLPESWEAMWSDGSTGSEFTAPEAGSYSLITTNVCGEEEYPFEVLANPCACEVYIPNAFTPDQDGTNETIFPVFACDPEEFTWLVFNRWGELVFEGDITNSGWNGNHQEGDYFCENGIYNYVLSVNWLNGEVQQFKGSISLLR